ncbi:MAG TPA: hypothetical protein VFH27_03015 [Longimicrobiaceae bacterium]|nr:hypothetical protein [Longimicrobiaceae bacterium]
MEKKVKLDVDGLLVETFATNETREDAGTVVGYASMIKTCAVSCYCTSVNIGCWCTEQC